MFEATEAARLMSVLADMQFPARSWQLIAHAEHRGADWISRAELRGLPEGRYLTLPEVLVAARDARRAKGRRRAWLA